MIVGAIWGFAAWSIPMFLVALSAAAAERPVPRYDLTSCIKAAGFAAFGALIGHYLG